MIGGGFPRGCERPLDLALLAAGYPADEILRLPDRHPPAQITDHDIDTPVTRISEDQIRLAAGRPNQQAEHLLKILTRASQARPRLVHGEVDHRFLRHRQARPIPATCTRAPASIRRLRRTAICRSPNPKPRRL